MESTVLPSVGGIVLSGFWSSDFLTQIPSYSLPIYFTMQNSNDTAAQLPFRGVAENGDVLDNFTIRMDGQPRNQNDYEIYKNRMDELMEEIKETLSEIPYIDKLMEINGIGIKTVSCVIAEVGDIGRFDNPKQVQKLAGYAIVADSSGKHNGASRISHRGRKRLRYALYEAAISVIGKNKEFKEIHSYYRTREKNPLKKMQSVIAVACKLIRIFYTILTKGVDYDGQRMLADIVRPEMQLAA